MERLGDINGLTNDSKLPNITTSSSTLWNPLLHGGEFSPAKSQILLVKGELHLAKAKCKLANALIASFRAD